MPPPRLRGQAHARFVHRSTRRGRPSSLRAASRQANWLSCSSSIRNRPNRARRTVITAQVERNSFAYRKHGMRLSKKLARPKRPRPGIFALFFRPILQVRRRAVTEIRRQRMQTRTSHARTETLRPRASASTTSSTRLCGKLSSKRTQRAEHCANQTSAINACSAYNTRPLPSNTVGSCGNRRSPHRR